MKKILLGTGLTLALSACFGQQSEGSVIYERTQQLQFRMPLDIDNDMGGAAQAIPQTRTTKYKLSFAGNKSLLKTMEEDSRPEVNGEGNGFQFRMMMPGADDVTFMDFANGTSTQKRELFDKTFLVQDSVRKLNWKIGSETKTILGHTARMATTERITKTMRMSMENGKMERKEVPDTANITAWFTTDIPVSAGPDLQGQLPGLILALDIGNGRMVYRAVSMETSADVASIKAPAKGKKVTQAEFEKERQSMIEEMQKNSQGGRRIIRMN